MSQSEDYLDGLLNSINKAKTDAEQVQEDVERKSRQVTESRRTVAPEEDFFTATGIDVQQAQTKSSHPYLRKVLSEEDFLRQFEEELDTDDVDAFISAFEQEIDEEERRFQETGELPESENVVDALLDNIDNAVSDAKRQLDEESTSQEESVDAEEATDTQDDTEENLFDLESASDESPASSITGDEPISLPDEDEEIDLSAFLQEDEEGGDSDEDSLSLDDLLDMSSETADGDGADDFGFSLDDATGEVENEPLDDSMKEFLPDEMDALDDLEFGDGEEPDLSGEGDLDLENILDGDDEDLLDIQSILSGDEEGVEEGAEIDDSAEDGGDIDEESGKKGRKKKKDKKAKGDKKGGGFLAKLALIVFGAPDEDDIAEAEAEAAKKAAATVEITYDEDGNPIIPEGAEAPEDKKKKKKEKKEKPKKEKKEKPPKPPKPPKPKKEKKPKEPDNSPKIPISIIATFLVLSISIIGVVMVGMTFTGLKRHMAQAEELFAAGDYIGAYEKVNGFSLTDEKVLLLRNQARTLADLQQCQDEYNAFIQFEKYNYALDSLIKGVGRYEKYKDDAAEYGISEQYEAYYQNFVSQLSERFGLTADDALAIYNQPNRHYYTIELRKVLRSLGLPDL